MLVRFVFGLIVGSFVNVLVSRYDENEFLFSKRVLGGRSFCPSCHKTLFWYELIPLFSFFWQKGKCRGCGKKISWKYPVGEILSGLIFAFVPLYVPGLLATSFWVVVFIVLLLLAEIDLRLSIIPDELNIILFVLGIILIVFNIPSDFVGPNALLFGLQGNRILNHILAAIILGLFFGAVIFLTRGRGMGLGDLKLAIPLGLIFGWPGGLLISAFGFISGAVVGLFMIVFKKRTMKGYLPFGPFLVFGAATLFFFGRDIMSFYFNFLGELSQKIFGT